MLNVDELLLEVLSVGGAYDYSIYVDCNENEIEIQQIEGHCNVSNQTMIDIICILYIY